MWKTSRVVEHCHATSDRSLPSSISVEMERKRSAFSTSTPTSSSFSRPNMSQRPESPPASTYFPLLAGDADNSGLRPVPDAESHFAYSTTLRRHALDGSLSSPTEFAQAVNAEASSLWSRALRTVTGQPPERNVESGRGTPQPTIQRHQTKETLSARFAHCTIQVCTRQIPLELTGLNVTAYRIPYHTTVLQNRVCSDQIYLPSASPMDTTNSRSRRPNPCLSNSPKQSMSPRSSYCYARAPPSPPLWAISMML